jgi:hypothetical protein
MWFGPIIPTDPVLRESVRIAMGYLREIGQADDYRNVELAAGGVILEAYRNGVRNRIALANKAIAAIEKKPEPVEKIT